MPAIDQLINDLRADGAVDSQGSFTLDREQARAKMQKFQLVDARRYVLELVQAAVLRGATQIEFEIDADDMRMRFDGAPFVQAEIDDLYGSLFRDGDTRELRGVRQLALALNAALGLNPKYIEMRSGVVELRMVPGALDEISVREQAGAETQIHVRQRLRARVFVDFFRDLAGGLPEEMYLEQRCRYCTVPITLDGRLISYGFNLDSREPKDRGFASIPINGSEFRGVMTIVEHREHLELRLVKDGVWIDSSELHDAGTNIIAVVEGDSLRKDVSQAKIVADGALEQIERSVARGRWRLWKTAAEQLARGRWRQWKTAAEQLAGQDLPVIQAMIRTQMLHHIAPADLTYIADAHALASQVVWDDCRDRDRQISLRDLMDLVAAGETPSYATTAYLEQEAKGAPILYIEDLDDIQALARVLGRALVYADGLLALERRRIRGREAWLGRAGKPRLPSQVNFAVRSRIDVELEVGRMRGEIGVDDQMLRSPDIASPVHLFLYNDGHLLGRSELDLNLPNVWLALEAGVTPNDDYTDARRDTTFGRVLLHGLAALSDSCVSLFNIAEADSSRNQSRVFGLIKHWLMSMVDPGAQLALLAAAGCDAMSHVHVPVAELLPDLVQDGLLGDTKTPNYLAQLPLFDALVGPRRSLAQLAAQLRAHGQITYVQEWPSNRQLVAEGVLVLGPGDRRILAALFGHNRLQKWDMEPRRRELEFHQREPVSIADQRRATTRRLAEAGLESEHWLVDLDEGPTQGFVIAEYADGAFEQLAELELDEFDEALVWIRYRDRDLCELSLEGCFGPLNAAVEHPGLQPSPQWDDVVRDQAFDQVVAAVRHASEHLFARLCRSYAAQPPAAQRWLARVLLRGIAAAPKRRFEIAKHVDLLATVEGRTLSLARASAVIEAHAKLEYASRDAGWAPLHDPPVIVAEDGMLADLGALFGDALVDGNDRVRHHTVFNLLEHRPPLTEAKLDPAETLVRVELRGDAQIGEVGISSTRREPGLRLRLGVAGREVEVLHDDQYIHLPLDAVALDEHLPLTAEGRVDARSKRVRALVRQCRRRVPALILGLCERWPALTEPEQAVAWRMLVAQLTVEADQDRRKQREQAFEAAATVLGFREIRGQRHSLAALTDAAKYRPLDVLTGEHFRESTLEFAGFDRLVLTVDNSELECLRAHCEVREIDDVWEDELAAIRSFAQAPIVELPNIQDVAIAYRKAMAAGGLECELWLPRGASLLGGKPILPKLIFARAGRELERRVLFETLPCAGIVSGDGLIASGGKVELDQRQRVSLERQLMILYLELAQAVASDRVASKDHADALAYLAWVDHRLRSDKDALEVQGKRYLALRRQLDQLVPPSLRDALTRRDATPTPAKPMPAKPEPAPIITAPQPASRPTQFPVAPTQPPAPAANPDQRLLAAVYEQLHWARATHHDLLDDLLLNHLSLETTGTREIASLEQRGLVINRDHPIVARLLLVGHGGPGEDPFELAFLVAALYSLMNHKAVEISDDDERRFVAQLAESLALSLRATGC